MCTLHIIIKTCIYYFSVNTTREEETSFDSGDEEFIPRDTSEPMRQEKNRNFLDTTDDSADEFDLRGQLHMKGENRLQFYKHTQGRILDNVTYGL